MLGGSAIPEEWGFSPCSYTRITGRIGWIERPLNVPNWFHLGLRTTAYIHSATFVLEEAVLEHSAAPEDSPLHQWTTRPDKQKIMRCPYCVEGEHFLAMAEQKQGDWWLCERCGHLALPSKPFFKCTCGKCVRVYGLNRKRERTVARSCQIRLRYFLRRLL